MSANGNMVPSSNRSFTLLNNAVFKTGVVRVWNADQLRSHSVHHLNISVNDGVFSARTRLTITVQPTNEHSPVFQKTDYLASVQENSPARTLVAEVTAVDSDAGRYGNLTYSLLQGASRELFSVDKFTGE